MLTNNFTKRLNEAIKLRNLKQVDLIKKTKNVMQQYIKNYNGNGIDKTLLNKYIKGKATAKQDNIFFLAKALDVNETWLMGLDVPMERKDNDSINNELKEKIESLNEEQKKAIISIIDNMK